MSTVTLSSGRTIDLREPTAGELRGVKLLDLMQLDPGAAGVVVERVSELTRAEFDALAIQDATRIMAALLDFFPRDLTA